MTLVAANSNYRAVEALVDDDEGPAIAAKVDAEGWLILSDFSNDNVIVMSSAQAAALRRVLDRVLG